MMQLHTAAVWKTRKEMKGEAEKPERAFIARHVFFSKCTKHFHSFFKLYIKRRTSLALLSISHNLQI